jgi:hypothetical protein
VRCLTRTARNNDISDALKLGPAFDPEWTLPSMLDRNPLVWMAEVNGYLVDLFTQLLSYIVQEVRSTTPRAKG